MTVIHNIPLFALGFASPGPGPCPVQVREVGLAGPRPCHATLAEASVKRSPEGADLRRLLESMGRGPIQVVCHGTPFAQGLLERWAERLHIDLPDIHWACSMTLARELCLDSALNGTLPSLARLLGLDCGSGPLALARAELILRIYLALLDWIQVKTALGEKDPLVYLAGPLRGNGTAEDIRHNQARMILQARWAQAVLPKATLLVPHTNFAFLDESQDPKGEVRRLALRSCKKALSRCDAMILCGWELSPGMEQEKTLAENLGIPVYQVPGWDSHAKDCGKPGRPSKCQEEGNPASP